VWPICVQVFRVGRGCGVRRPWGSTQRRFLTLARARLSLPQVFKVLKNAVVDTVHAWQGQKVAVNFVFFTLAYVESEAPVDRELSAVG
jgi:hypothetical protein